MNKIKENKKFFLKNPRLWLGTFAVLLIALFLGSCGMESVDSSKVGLYLVNADTHEYREATAKNPQKEIFINFPIKTKLNEKGEGTLVLGVNNSNDQDIKNAQLIVTIPKEIKLIDYEGFPKHWKAVEPSTFKAKAKKIKKMTTKAFSRLVFKPLDSQQKVFEIKYKISCKGMDDINRSFYLHLSE